MLLVRGKFESRSFSTSKNADFNSLQKHVYHTNFVLCFSVKSRRTIYCKNLNQFMGFELQKLYFHFFYTQPSNGLIGAASEAHKLEELFQCFEIFPLHFKKVQITKKVIVIYFLSVTPIVSNFVGGITRIDVGQRVARCAVI